MGDIVTLLAGWYTTRWGRYDGGTAGQQRLHTIALLDGTKTAGDVVALLDELNGRRGGAAPTLLDGRELDPDTVVGWTGRLGSGS